MIDLKEHHDHLSPDDDRLHCRFAMAEVRAMSKNQTEAINKLYDIIDNRVGQLIDLLEKRFDSPWATINRMMVLVGLAILGVFIFSYANQHGANAVDETIKTITNGVINNERSR